MTRRGLISAVVLAAALSACAGGFTAVSGPFPAGSSYTLQLGRTWSDISVMMPNRPSTVRVLSIDGPFLNRLYVAHDIEPGSGLSRPTSREDRLPVFRADMTSRELVELITDTLVTYGLININTTDLRPVQFSGRRGVQFSFSGQTIAGLRMVGQAVASGQDGRLNTVIWIVAEEHYAPLHQAEIDGIFASVIAAPAPAPAPQS